MITPLYTASKRTSIKLCVIDSKISYQQQYLLAKNL